MKSLKNKYEKKNGTLKGYYQRPDSDKKYHYIINNKKSREFAKRAALRTKIKDR